MTWTISENQFEPINQHHKETIFTIGNGYLCTRGTLEEGFPGDHRATFLHGVFDAVPIVMTELANAPDWLPLTVLLDGERFSLSTGRVGRYERALDLRSGMLRRQVRWISPQGRAVSVTFERFASLADPHLAVVRCQITPEDSGPVEICLGLNGNTDNEGFAHWDWVTQGKTGEVVYLHNRTRKSKIELVSTMYVELVKGNLSRSEFWDVENFPTVSLLLEGVPGETIIVDKFVALASSRDTERPLEMALEHVRATQGWSAAVTENGAAWEQEWQRTDVIIDGDDEAQIAIRFNLYHMLIAAPRHDERVNIGAKTLSGFGYRGHAFWDTEIFMLPLFIYTAPHIARNLLNYRYWNLPGAHAKALSNGYEGAQFPWESADTGEEVTPSWVPHFADRTKLVRIWTGDVEIHITADIAYAAYQYWRVSGDDAWMIERGAEIILDCAKFWASRAEWNAQAGRYEYTDVIGPDEYHEHVDNNAFTNRMAGWNLQTALDILEWLSLTAPARRVELVERLDLTSERLAHWRDVIDKIYLNADEHGLIEQFDGYYLRRYVDLARLEPRDKSAQEIFGIEGCNETQVLKQPDVLMLQYLLREHYSDEVVRLNYEFYTPRTDHTYGSSLGPSIQAIMACEVGRLQEGYEHFIRAARADLRDVRGNARDGIHAASAAGTWQAIVFGFAGLRVTQDGWTIRPRLPAHWQRLAFKFMRHGKVEEVEIQRED